MQDFRAAAIQMNAPLGEVEGNLAQIERWAREAAEEGAHLICFPELAISGHWCAGDIWDVSEPVPGGPSCRRVERLAEELGCVISVGIAEREAGVAYNTQMIVGPGGLLGKQRKLHMSSDEYFHFRMGASINVIDIGVCQVGVGICYDTVFPETARIAAIKGAEVYLAPHAARCGEWIDDVEKQRQKVASVKENACMTFRSRAYDNGMFVIYCNQAGPAGEETNHCGGVLFIDPSGKVIAQSQTELIEDEMVVCDLDAEAYRSRRRGRCFNLQTRRPEIYGEICCMSD
ncbi:MAG: nitrilase-related carbon-nitrogen hydrolase [Armatimonadota bacterium]|nr:nitrilase-related carbon-nitrogen hydrolase [Armatimonadota bacterium]